MEVMRKRKLYRKLLQGRHWQWGANYTYKLSPLPRGEKDFAQFIDVSAGYHGQGQRRSMNPENSCMTLCWRNYIRRADWVNCWSADRTPYGHWAKDQVTPRHWRAVAADGSHQIREIHWERIHFRNLKRRLHVV